MMHNSYVLFALGWLTTFAVILLVFYFRRKYVQRFYPQPVVPAQVFFPNGPIGNHGQGPGAIRARRKPKGHPLTSIFRDEMAKPITAKKKRNNIPDSYS